MIRAWLCTAAVEGVAWQGGIMHGLFFFLSGCWRGRPPAPLSLAGLDDANHTGAKIGSGV